MPLTPRQRALKKRAAARADTSLVVARPLDMDDERKPWEQQPKEPPTAYTQFTVYRDMEPVRRNWANVCRALAQPYQNIHARARQYKWVTRAAAWDLHLERAKLAQSESYQLEMALRHAEIAQVMLAKVRQRLESINFKALDPKVVAQWLDIGVKVERLARGVAPDQVANITQTINVDLRKMSEAEILKEIAKESRAVGSIAAPIDISAVETEVPNEPLNQ